jgi:hypothetical protein
MLLKLSWDRYEAMSLELFCIQFFHYRKFHPILNLHKYICLRNIKEKNFHPVLNSTSDKLERGESKMGANISMNKI